MTNEQDLFHLMVWGCTREGMSEMATVTRAALLDDESLMLVTKGAIATESMPPGFVRFLTDEEMIAKNLHFVIPSLTIKVGRKWNTCQSARQEKAVPYYRQFDKRKIGSGLINS